MDWVRRLTVVLLATLAAGPQRTPPPSRSPRRPTGSQTTGSAPRARRGRRHGHRHPARRPRVRRPPGIEPRPRGAHGPVGPLGARRPGRGDPQPGHAHHCALELRGQRHRRWRRPPRARRRRRGDLERRPGQPVGADRRHPLPRQRHRDGQPRKARFGPVLAGGASGGHGGAIALDSGTAEISATTFDRNGRATGGPGSTTGGMFGAGFGGSGGAIAVVGGASASVINSTFSGNLARREGPGDPPAAPWRPAATPCRAVRSAPRSWPMRPRPAPRCSRRPCATGAGRGLQLPRHRPAGTAPAGPRRLRRRRGRGAAEPPEAAGVAQPRPGAATRALRVSSR